MWRRERRLIQVVGIEGENSHLTGTSVGKDSSVRLSTQPRIIDSSSIKSFSSQGGKGLARHVFVQQKHSWTSDHYSATSVPHFLAHQRKPLYTGPAPSSGA